MHRVILKYSLKQKFPKKKVECDKFIDASMRRLDRRKDHRGLLRHH